MTLPKIIRTPDGYYKAKLDGVTTLKFGTPISALRTLCEMLVQKRKDQRRKDWPWQPTGPCDCGGHGYEGPLRCPGCGR